MYRRKRSRTAPVVVHMVIYIVHAQVILVRKSVVQVTR
jgi:hypothetical protein